ncbi:MAG: 4-(cytidine 5'-diphospho)-2-C-methyl-D-erythritol kinase [Peptostreptococcales bacterium]|jgi:4-diphosphocytidyl-2-C-methyl-D-erythritol kinase
MIKLKARAKINLALDVVRKRDDGYHDVRMIMQQIDLFDEIEIRKIPKKIIYIQSNRRYSHSYKNDMTYKAANLLYHQFNIHEGIEIKVQKKIPVAAGLAGGSTDAAAVLLGVNQLFNLGLKKEELMDMALPLGADVPFCILGGCALAEGIGEKLTPLKALNAFVVLCKPNMRISTKSVYEKLKLNEIKEHPPIEKIISFVENQDFLGLRRNTKNLLESVTLEENHVVKVIKNALLDTHAEVALMSGSGPTVFGLFKDKNTAQNAYSKLKKLHDEVYLVKTFTGD